MGTRYRIAVAIIKHYMNVREVVISPAADANVVMIAGENGAGKTSVLGALDAALRGKRAIAADPVHHGAEDAEVSLKLTGGPIAEIERVILPNGDTHLEVRNAEGAAFRSPQELLDAIVGDRFVDPLRFLNVTAKEQRQTLLSLIDSDKKLDKLDERHAAIFSKRRDVGRDLKNAEGELRRIPEVAELPMVNVAALAAERAKLAEQQRAGDKLELAQRTAESALATVQADIGATTRRIEETQRAIEELQRKLGDDKAQLRDLGHQRVARERAVEEAQSATAAALAEWEATAPRRAQLDAELARADETNRAASDAQVSRRRRSDAQATVEKLTGLRDEQTTALAKIDKQRSEILAKAELPIEGLGFDADGLTMVDPSGKPVPFAQASGAQQFRVALAVAAASSPHLDDVWIRNAGILSDASMDLIREFAERTGKRFWLEIIRPQDDAIVLHEGRVVGEDG